MNNIEWLNEIFSRPHFSTMILIPSYAPKWFMIEGGIAYYNPKKILHICPTEFKAYVFKIIKDKIGTFKHLELECLGSGNVR